MTSSSLTSSELDILARTCWGEARGEGVAGMQAVAWVVRNRAESGTAWWGSSITSVCLKKYQFSCWNANDPNYPYLSGAKPIPPAGYALALAAARGVAEGSVPDPTGGATHYYAASIPPPAWAKSATFTARIGNHLFFKDVP